MIDRKRGNWFEEKRAFNYADYFAWVSFGNYNRNDFIKYAVCNDKWAANAYDRCVIYGDDCGMCNWSCDGRYLCTLEFFWTAYYSYNGTDWRSWRGEYYNGSDVTDWTEGIFEGQAFNWKCL